MRLSILTLCFALNFLCMAPAPSFAEKVYLCAISEVYECVAVKGCSRVSLETANLPAVVRVDVKAQKLSSAPLGQEPAINGIDNVTETDDSVLLNGIGKAGQKDRTWSALISSKTGKMTAGVSTPDASLALVGECTAIPPTVQ
jgi:hypothetical protein